MTKKTVFWFIIGILVASILMLAGATFTIPTPGKWLGYIIVAAVALIVGYILGKKADGGDKK